MVDYIKQVSVTGDVSTIVEDASCPSLFTSLGWTTRSVVRGGCKGDLGAEARVRRSPRSRSSQRRSPCESILGETSARVGVTLTILPSSLLSRPKRLLSSRVCVERKKRKFQSSSRPEDRGAVPFFESFFRHQGNRASSSLFSRPSSRVSALSISSVPLPKSNTMTDTRMRVTRPFEGALINTRSASPRQTASSPTPSERTSVSRETSM